MQNCCDFVFSLKPAPTMAPSEIKKVKKSKKSKTEAAPTLSSFLLGQVDSTDSALDNIFATSVRTFLWQSSLYRGS